jgi:hypothetical protein
MATEQSTPSTPQPRLSARGLTYKVLLQELKVVQQKDGWSTELTTAVIAYAHALVYGTGSVEGDAASVAQASQALYAIDTNAPGIVNRQFATVCYWFRVRLQHATLPGMRFIKRYKEFYAKAAGGRVVKNKPPKAAPKLRAVQLELAFN